ncbi:MAG: hypothetical protein VB012_00760 [Erysipelotrichaceae bacterium]|nr:hypothetical protein [Erysipelotrichaceae bacterium]
MKRLVVLFLTVILLGCSPAASKEAETVEALSILAPKGAPALTLITYADAYGQDNLTLVDGTDVISAALLNPTPEYDVIIAPINLGAVTINKGSDYRLLGVITWGNLYLVANTDLTDSTLPIAMFGEGAVPQKVVDASVDLTTLGKDVQYYNSVADVQVALLTQSASYGLLAEPALTATLAKATAAGINLEVVYDIQAEYNAKNGTSGYPQAAVFVLNSTYEDNKASYDELVSYLSDLNAENVTALLSGNEETYGVPSAAIITQAWDGINIEYKGYQDVKTEISAFLKLFNIDSVENLFVD